MNWPVIHLAIDITILMFGAILMIAGILDVIDDRKAKRKMEDSRRYEKSNFDHRKELAELHLAAESHLKREQDKEAARAENEFADFNEMCVNAMNQASLFPCLDDTSFVATIRALRREHPEYWSCTAFTLGVQIELKLRTDLARLASLTAL